VETCAINVRLVKLPLITSVSHAVQGILNKTGNVQLVPPINTQTMERAACRFNHAQQEAIWMITAALPREFANYVLMISIKMMGIIKQNARGSQAALLQKFW
jgi:hypothetical protein